MKLKALTKWLLVIGLIACGDNSTPPLLPPLAKANIVMSGGEQWLGCILGCSFQAAARNLGPGCARAVRGAVLFFNEAGVQLEGVYPWLLASDIVVRSNELFSYRTTSSGIGNSVRSQASTYTTEFSWTDTPC
jgi:hypothetical protein